MKGSLLAFAIVGALDLDSPSIPAGLKWDEWKSIFGKSYSTEDGEAIAYKKFQATDTKINAHNAKGDTWMMGHNQFSAMTPDEFSDFVGHNDMRRKGPFDFAEFPDREKNDSNVTIDWIAKGAVTPVKDQQFCGGCWAFSAIGAMEGAYQIAGNPLTQLSEQELVSCENQYHHGKSGGCNGGFMDDAFDWFASYHGACTEEDYPFTSITKTQKCQGGVKGPNCTAVAKCDGHKDVKTEADLLAALAIGPVSVAIEADKKIFQNYKSGVIGAAGNNACGTQLDHGVLVVAAGTESNLPKYPGDHYYWKIKNSWNSSYGDAGYVRIVRDLNECGITEGPPSYPVNVTKV